HGHTVAHRCGGELAPRPRTSDGGAMRPRCTIIPPYLLERLQDVSDEQVARCAVETLQQDEEHRAGRHRAQAQRAAEPPPGPPAPGRPDMGAHPTATAETATPQRTIADAAGSTTLPGRTVRT